MAAFSSLQLLRHIHAPAPFQFTPAQQRQLITQGFGPLLYWLAQQQGQRVIEPAQAAYMLNRLYHQKMLNGLRTLLERVPGSELIPLKGLSVTNRYYSQPALRVMGDMDVLVKDAAPWREVLAELGYETRSSESPEYYRNHHHDVPYYHPRDQIWLELHTGLFPAASSIQLDGVFKKSFWEKQLVQETWDTTPVTLFNREYELIYICTHWALEFKTNGGLNAVMDVLFMLKHDVIDWDRLAAMCRGKKSAALVYLLLSYISHHELAPLDSRVLKLLRRNQNRINAVNLKMLIHIADRVLACRRRLFGFLKTYQTQWVWFTLFRHEPAWLNAAAAIGYFLSPKRWLRLLRRPSPGAGGVDGRAGPP